LNNIALPLQINTMTKSVKKLKEDFTKKIKRTKKVDLQTAITTRITNPNGTWKNLEREKYMVPKSYFQNN
jgi:hypothetical protein